MTLQQTAFMRDPDTGFLWIAQRRVMGSTLPAVGWRLI
jgi:hypothetical protein